MIIANSTPLINFSVIHRLDILEQLIGSIGCLVEAKRRQIIPAIKPLLDAMQTDARFWIHKNLYIRILRDHHE